MSKPEEKRFPEGKVNPAARGESSGANTFHEIATMWALDEVGHPNTLIIEGLAPEEATRAKSIRDAWFDRFIQGMWRGEFTGLFLEYPPDGTEEDMDGGVWLDTNDDDGALTAERDRQPINRDLLWEMLKPHGLPQGVRRDAPDFDVLAGISAADYSEVARLSLLENIKVEQEDCLRWCVEQGIKPPKRQRGRWPASHSQHDTVWALFDEMKINFTFERGELTRIGKKISNATDYKPGTITDKIRSDYNILKQKAPPK